MNRIHHIAQGPSRLQKAGGACSWGLAGGGPPPSHLSAASGGDALDISSCRVFVVLFALFFLFSRVGFVVLGLKQKRELPASAESFKLNETPCPQYVKEHHWEVLSLGNGAFVTGLKPLIGQVALGQGSASMVAQGSRYVF